MRDYFHLGAVFLQRMIKNDMIILLNTAILLTFGGVFTVLLLRVA